MGVMRGYLAMGTAVAVFAAVLWFSANSAAAQSCGGAASGIHGGASAVGYCVGGRPGGIPTSASSSNPEGRWDFFCKYPWMVDYQPGYTVDLRGGSELLDPALFDWIVAQGLDPSGIYRSWNVHCLNDAGVQLHAWAGFLTTSVPPVDPAVLRDQALANINFPDPEVDGLQTLTHAAQLESWFWIENDWVPITDSSSQGLVTVVVQATPDVVVWNPGDGTGTFDCNDPGIEWSSAVNDGGTTCGHVYESGTADVPGLAYQASATIEWELTWAVNGLDQGVFGTGDATSVFPVPVGEVQIVEVS